MSFAQIERVIGFKLPPVAQRHRAWWSNSALNNVMTKAWLEAGFRSEQVDMAGGKVVFRREARGTRLPRTKSERHPIFGCMKGTVTVEDGVDVAAMADPEWADLIDEKYGRETPLK
ncbi:MAG: hypothetical protein JSS22_03165 [Proteobacteria bacterium]|nr:hypothetical protein [Pseudomonadota bacterium]